jgi:hypothetical protein
MRPVQTGKQRVAESSPRSIQRQGVQMIIMFPIVIAVTLLLALGEVATGEARRGRFVTQ